jgi:HEAT repeats
MDFSDLKKRPPWEWPPAAGEILARTLRNSGSAASDRIDAAEMAGDLVVMDDKIADLLLSIVRNAGEPELLRARAAISFGPALELTDTEGFDDDLSEPPISKKTFDLIQETLHGIYLDEGAPKEVRRRVLEASVRAEQDWHRDAVRAAYVSGDEQWKLTAVFCMQYVHGFDDQVIEMLRSRNPEIHYEAVVAAGSCELRKAWPHVAALIASKKTEKRLRLAAIEASASINPEEASSVLAELLISDDEEIKEAAIDAMAMAEACFDEDDDEEDEEDSKDPVH